MTVPNSAILGANLDDSNWTIVGVYSEMICPFDLRFFLRITVCSVPCQTEWIFDNNMKNMNITVREILFKVLRRRIKRWWDRWQKFCSTWNWSAFLLATVSQSAYLSIRVGTKSKYFD